jgi:endonuclease YncB( thermonuclease family)
MPKGFMRVSGTLDLTQFWRSGESDADTAKVNVTSIEFSPDPDAHIPFRKTTVFNNAFVKGGQGKPKPAIKAGRITVRFQGIDAMELHFAAMLKKKGLKNNGTKYRQYFGETATVKLHDFLFGLQKKNTLPCEVVSFVDHPNDVFDMYGRMIGDIVVTLPGKEVNANHWLAEKGWAVPTFYNSMSAKEIATIGSFADKARKAKAGLWAHYSNDVATPNVSLLYEKKGTFNPKRDTGPAVMPKLFRRQIRYSVSLKNSLFTGKFRDYLLKQKDGWVKTVAFVKNTHLKPSKASGKLGVLVSSNGKFGVLPGDIVFFEGASTLLDAKGNRITSWF